MGNDRDFAWVVGPDGFFTGVAALNANIQRAPTVELDLKRLRVRRDNPFNGNDGREYFLKIINNSSLTARDLRR